MERRQIWSWSRGPPGFGGDSHPYFESLGTGGRAVIARREDSDWMVASGGGYTWEAEGDVQVLALGRTGHTGKVARVVNEYLIPGGWS